MTAADLIVGRRYLLGFGPVDARVFDVSGEYVRSQKSTAMADRAAPLIHTFRLNDGSTYSTGYPERDVCEIEEAE